MDNLAFFEAGKIKIIASSEMIDKIRELPGRKYHGPFWTASLSKQTIDKLEKLGFQLDDKLQNIRSDFEKQKEEIISSEFIGTPYPFQKEGIAFINQQKGNALIGDDPGLGKTMQAILWMQMNNINNVVIVCPASLKLNWQKEINIWCKKDAEILFGTTPYSPSNDIVIINYDIISNWIDLLKTKELIIIDEAQYIRCDSERAKVVKRICKTIPYKIALSGTPIEGKQKDIYNIWHILNPTSCPTKKMFNKLGNKELHNYINTFMIRRMKTEVLKELPEKTRVFVPVELTNWNEYKEAENDFIAYVRRQKGLRASERARNAESFTKIETLKQITAKGKIESVKEWICTFLQSGEKLVVFCTHSFVIEELAKKFPKALKMDGSISMEKRQQMVNDFQSKPDIKLFIGMLDVEGRPAGVGWTLTSAFATATIELQWNPKVHDQAEDRVHRIGQKNAVFSYYLLANNTIEEKIAKIQDKKRIMIDSVIDDIKSESLLTELMNEYL